MRPANQTLEKSIMGKWTDDGGGGLTCVAAMHGGVVAGHGETPWAWQPLPLHTI